MIRGGRFILALVAFFWLSGMAVGHAASPGESAAVPTFTTTRYPLGVGSYGGIVDKSSPTLADLDGDGIPEVLVGTTAFDGSGQYNKPTYLVVLKRNPATGNMEVRYFVDVGAPINSAPAVGDIDGDGDMEVVVTTGGDVFDLNQHAGIRVYDRTLAVLEWFFDGQDHNGDGWKEGTFSSPTLCDVDGDGDQEIAFGGWDQRIYLLDHEGHSLWNNIPAGTAGPGFYTADSIWSTAVCADLNRDGYEEIIIGGDISGGGVLPDGTYTTDGGFIYIFDKDGNVLVRRLVPETVYASPAVADLDGDGDLEIVSGTGWYWWYHHGRTGQPYVYVFETGQVFNASLHYSDPTKLPLAPGWPRTTNYPGFSSPALADLDGDGDLEIVIGTSDPFLCHTPGCPNEIAGDGSVYAWHHNGQPVSGWPIHPVNEHGNDAPIFSSPTIADVDGDSDLEVLFAVMWDVHVYHHNGTPLVLKQTDGRQDNNVNGRLQSQWSVWASPAVGDADGDGRMEIWIGGGNCSDQGRGYLHRFEVDVQVAAGEENLPWPQFHIDSRNIGRYMPPLLDALPGSLYLMREYGGDPFEWRTLSLSNQGEGEIAWQVDAYPADVALGSTSGTVNWAGQTIPLTISVSAYETGTHDLGSIVLTGTVGSDPVPVSPPAIPVMLYVGPVHRVFLPLALKNAN